MVVEPHVCKHRLSTSNYRSSAVIPKAHDALLHPIVLSVLNAAKKIIRDTLETSRDGIVDSAPRQTHHNDIIVDKRISKPDFAAGIRWNPNA
jgi:hypothetical protein